MKIENNKVVSFHYQLRDLDGEHNEDSRGGDPMLYLHGYRGILPGLEDAMLGRTTGDKFTVSLSAADAYGPRNDAAAQRVPRKHLIDQTAPKAGQIVTVNTRNGKVKATIIKVGRFNVDIDTNHPLAGKSLEFTVEIMSVREATMDEVAHRHAHGPGGHQH